MKTRATEAPYTPFPSGSSRWSEFSFDFCFQQYRRQYSNPAKPMVVFFSFPSASPTPQLAVPMRPGVPFPRALGDSG